MIEDIQVQRPKYPPMSELFRKANKLGVHGNAI